MVGLTGACEGAELMWQGEIDTNKDGQATLEEIKAFVKKARVGGVKGCERRGGVSGVSGVSR